MSQIGMRKAGACFLSSRTKQMAERPGTVFPAGSLSPGGTMQGYDTVDLSTLGRADRYKILTGAVVPRPIAFVTTLAPSGVVNAAPFSQFVIVAVDPGLLG